MAGFRTNSSVLRRLAAGTALAAGLLGVNAHAAPLAATCADPAIVIDLDDKSLNINYRDNSAVLRAVTIRQCDNRIEADEARSTGGIAFENSRWTFSGNVRITASGGNMRSDKAVVEFRNNLISEAIITGTPAEFEQKRTDGNTSHGHANTIGYVAQGGKITLRDNAWLSDGCNEITGKQLVYNIAAQRVEGQPRTSTTQTGDGRIRITIQPKSESDASGPCSKKPPDRKP
jgi:lipopolysaccharide transport protein LptA